MLYLKNFCNFINIFIILFHKLIANIIYSIILLFFSISNILVEILNFVHHICLIKFQIFLLLFVGNSFWIFYWECWPYRYNILTLEYYSIKQLIELFITYFLLSFFLLFFFYLFFSLLFFSFFLFILFCILLTQSFLFFILFRIRYTSYWPEILV